MKITDKLTEKREKLKTELTESVTNGESDKVLQELKGIITAVIKVPLSLCKLLSLNLLLASDSTKYSMRATSTIITVIVAAVFLLDFFILNNSSSLILGILTPFLLIPIYFLIKPSTQSKTKNNKTNCKDETAVHTDSNDILLG